MRSVLKTAVSAVYDFQSFYSELVRKFLSNVPSAGKNNTACDQVTILQDRIQDYSRWHMGYCSESKLSCFDSSDCQHSLENGGNDLCERRGVPRCRDTPEETCSTDRTCTAYNPQDYCLTDSKRETQIPSSSPHAMLPDDDLNILDSKLQRYQVPELRDSETYVVRLVEASDSIAEVYVLNHTLTDMAATIARQNYGPLQRFGC